MFHFYCEVEHEIMDVSEGSDGRWYQMVERLMHDITYAKKCSMPLERLHYVYGLVVMAFELKAISAEDFLFLSHEAVCLGINNPKYFNK